MTCLNLPLSVRINKGNNLSPLLKLYDTFFPFKVRALFLMYAPLMLS